MPAKTGYPSDPIVLAANVGYYPDFLPSEQADVLLAALLNLEWSPPIISGMGPDSPMVACMGDASSSPRASSRKIVVKAWTPEATDIKLRVEERTSCAFDSLALNLYRDHRDCLGLRVGVNEEDLQTSPIAVVSLGAPRRFRWENAADGSTTAQLLEHGSLLLLPPGFHRGNHHELPKQEKPCGPRIGLTFSRRLAAKA